MRRGSRILLFCVVAVCIGGCGILPTEEEFEAAPLVKEYESGNTGKYTVARGDMVQTESIAVKYQGTKKVELTGTNDGIRIKKICVAKGQKVKKGQTLVQEYLEDEEEALKSDKRQIESLQLQISQAKKMKKRELEQLSKTGGSREEKDNVRSQYDAQIKNCKSTLELTKLDIIDLEETIRTAVIVAPISGKVTFTDNSFEGGYANEENTLVTVQAAKKNRFRCETEYAGYFKEGREVTVTVLGRQYETTVKKGKGNELFFYPKHELTLKNSASGTIDLILKEKKNVLCVPTALIYDIGEKKMVYVEGENGVKEMREVTIGVQIQNQTEIINGLKENDQILTN